MQMVMVHKHATLLLSGIYHAYISAANANGHGTQAYNPAIIRDISCLYQCCQCKWSWYTSIQPCYYQGYIMLISVLPMQMVMVHKHATLLLSGIYHAYISVANANGHGTQACNPTIIRDISCLYQCCQCKWSWYTSMQPYYYQGYIMLISVLPMQ